MLFNSFEFLVFFIIVTTIYFILPHKLRWGHLLIASCIFYMYFIPIYILILAFTIIIDYFAGILIENNTGKKRKLYLVLSIVANMGILVFFKYYNFFVENINELFTFSNIKANIPLLKIILPIGLSFHTFQALSYTIEVYRGNQKPERHFGIYALYVMFYPQLVAGPIERPQNLLHQFHEKHRFDSDTLVEGLKLIVWGLFKKIVIADRLALTVDSVYNNYTICKGPEFLIATVFFVFQLYCDFSGYSDIALGTARIMGIKLMINFDRPLSSKSISELWRRWHISLSSWFYDYLFNPLAFVIGYLGNFGIPLALLITFLLSGLWHGAGFTFIIFGLLQGIAVAYEYFTSKIRKRISKQIPVLLNKSISKFVTFSYFAFSCIFFRANNLKSAFYIISHLFTGILNLNTFLQLKTFLSHLSYDSKNKIGDIDYSIINIFFSVILLILLEFIQSRTKERPVTDFLKGKSLLLRWSFYYTVILLIFLIGNYNNKEFIYFQF